VYSTDPKKDPSAKKYEKLTYQEALVQGLKVVDSTAFSLCMDNKMPMVVFGMEPAGNVTKPSKENGSELSFLSSR